MTARDFCFWLQGHIEIGTAVNEEAKPLDARQVHIIRQHLALVFKHEIDPSMGPPAHQAELNVIHGNKPVIGGTDANGNLMRC